MHSADPEVLAVQALNMFTLYNLGKLQTYFYLCWHIANVYVNLQLLEVGINICNYCTN